MLYSYKRIPHFDFCLLSARQLQYSKCVSFSIIAIICCLPKRDFFPYDKIAALESLDRISHIGLLIRVGVLLNMKAVSEGLSRDWGIL